MLLFSANEDVFASSGAYGQAVLVMLLVEWVFGVDLCEHTSTCRDWARHFSSPHSVLTSMSEWCVHVQRYSTIL
jgi:hypothetical protein